MDKLRFYEIDCDYINFLSAFAEHLFLNAKYIYNHKTTNDGKSKLSQRCNDFRLLEEQSKNYIKTNKKDFL